MSQGAWVLPMCVNQLGRLLTVYYKHLNSILQTPLSYRSCLQVNMKRAALVTVNGCTPAYFVV